VSDPNANLKLLKERILMYHYNDRFYESNCWTCKAEFETKTIREMKTLEEFHECGNAKLDTELGNLAKSGEDYLIEFTPTAEFSKYQIEKPGFIPNW
jgi:hypothetical protein